MNRSSHAVIRILVILSVVAVLAGSAFAAPRGRNHAPKERVPSIGKILKNIVRALGDGLTVPLP